MRKALKDGLRLSRVPTRKAIDAANESVNDVPASGEQVSQWNTSLDRLIRWNVFLTHVNLNANNLVDSVTGDTLSHDSHQFLQLRNKVNENTRTYKNQTLAMMMVGYTQ
jgi:hypothetical protein